MILSDLLRARVVDAEGTDIGSIDDIRLVQDGPVLGAFGAALRVEGLVVGHGASLGVRLGFHRIDTRGPFPLKQAFSALERTGHYVHWADVESIEGSVVRIRRRRDELEAPPAE